MPKGPTWDDIYGLSKTGRETEERHCGGYNRKIAERGKVRIELTCPFCQTPLWAYVWSLAASGKRCQCGALCGNSNRFYHWSDR